jgi:hypothetical protein
MGDAEPGDRGRRAAVSELIEEKLFYLRNRARNILTYAFVDKIRGGVDASIMGGFDDENGLRRRIIRRLENVTPKGEKRLVGGSLSKFQMD